MVKHIPKIIAAQARSILRLTKQLGRVRQAASLALLLTFSWMGTTPALAATAYTDNADGTVTDQATGLIWKRCAEGQSWTGSTCSGTPTSFTWNQANALTSTVTFAGSSVWRLPSITDLQTIVDMTASGATINATAFPNASSAAFWSATADSDNSNNGLYVSFLYGNSSTLNKANAFLAHLVRGTASTTGGGTTGGGTVGGGAGSLTILPSLAAGWNLLGNSLNTALTVAALYSDANVVNSVWKWDTTIPSWQFYAPSMTATALQTYATSKGYGVLSAINPGEGYWVNSKTKATLAAQTGAPFSVAATNLVTGWNLSATADDVSPAELNRRLSETPPSPDVIPNNFTTLWAWDNPTSNWYFYAPGLDASGTLASYISSKGYIDFAKSSRTLGNGTGFWINRTTATATIAPSLTISLTSTTGAAVTTLSGSTPTTVTATVTDAAGAAVPNAIVTFSTDATFATITQSTALTNAAGVATITMSPAGAAGANSITATAQVGTATVSGSKSYAIAAAAVPRITVVLTDSAGASVTNISSGNPATIKATLKDSSGAAVAGAVVTFSTDAAFGTITPGSATALTDTNGVASATLNAASLTAAGAATITATSQVGDSAVKGTSGYSVGAAVVAITTPAFALNPLSAYGTTSINVTVSIGGVAVTTPQTVTFTSSCASNGKATLTASVATVNGTATATYRDNGCASSDIVTASVSGITSSAATLTVSPPTAGSIQFVSATPSSLSLKGIGGTEASRLTFKVLDSSGNSLSGKTVDFSLNTTLGGIALTPSPSSISDDNGLAVVYVNSGTVSTPVRVTASIASSTLTSQSSALTITTGTPDQDSFSLSATKLNPEFWSIDGNTTVITARLADHFNNPVPNGTVVNFTTEGGSIVASCSTLQDSNGSSNCSTTLTSQAPRPANGRVTVLAYAQGEESFIDLNGNGVADIGEFTDLSEAYRDDDESGARGAGETFIDFNGNGAYDGPDGKYSGVLCDSRSAAGTCSGTKSIIVSKSIVIVFSGSTPFISKTSPAGTIDLVGGCSGTLRQVDLRIVDENGNPLPAGTTVAVTTTDGTISGTGSFVQANTNVTPAAGTANYTVFVRDDSANVTTVNTVTGVSTTTCTDTTLSGVLTVTVTTPGGVVQVAQYPVSN